MITDPTMKAILDKHLPPAQTREIRARTDVPLTLILEVVCRDQGITPEELLADTRVMPLVAQRQLAMYIACKLTPNSLNKIARFFKKGDHTTVIYARDTVQHKMRMIHSYAAEVQRLLELVVRVFEDLKATAQHDEQAWNLLRSME